MKRSTLSYLLALVVVLGVSPLVSAQDHSLEKCQKLKDKIDHYTNQRRAGGSASRMDKWKRARTQKQQAFNEHNCSLYRGELK